MSERLYIFHAKKPVGPDGWYGHFRPLIYAWPASAITSVQTLSGSENCYLLINGVEVEGSFETFVREWDGTVMHGAPISRKDKVKEC